MGRGISNFILLNDPIPATLKASIESYCKHHLSGAWLLKRPAHLLSKTPTFFWFSYWNKVTPIIILFISQ